MIIKCNNWANNIHTYLVIKNNQDKNPKQYRLHQQNNIMCPVEQRMKIYSQRAGVNVCDHLKEGKSSMLNGRTSNI